MASAPTGTGPQVQDVRALAQKLFGQCRDSPSSYKLLYPSVKKVRNVLEEVEDEYDDTRTLGPHDVKLLLQVAHCYKTLSRLDLALQSYRCSKQKDVDASTVGDFKTELDVVADELAITFEAINTGVTPLKLDTSVAADLPTASPSSRIQSALFSTTDSSHGRRSSRTSSMWSASHQSKPNTAETLYASGLQVQESDEKEACAPGLLYARPAKSIDAITLDWRSPFASPDPLSLSMEEATTMLLGSNEPADMVVSDHDFGENSTVTTEIHLHDREQSIEAQTTPKLRHQGPEDLAGLDKHPDVPVSHANDDHEKSSAGHSDAVEENDNQPQSSLTVEGSEKQRDLITDEESQASLHMSSASETSVVFVDAPSTTQDQEGDEKGAKDGTDRLYFCLEPQDDDSSTFSEANPVPSALRSDDGTFLKDGNVSSSAEVATLHQAAGEDSASVDYKHAHKTESTDQKHTLISDEVHMSNRLSSEAHNEGKQQVVISGIDLLSRHAIFPHISNKETTVAVPEDSDQTGSVPQMPDRRPPLPPPLPPRPRRARTRGGSKTYIITNADPVEDSSDEDDLYRTSRPSTPVVKPGATALKDHAVTVPEVKIDASACHSPKESASTQPGSVPRADSTSAVLPQTTYQSYSRARAASETRKLDRSPRSSLNTSRPSMDSQISSETSSVSRKSPSGDEDRTASQPSKPPLKIIPRYRRRNVTTGKDPSTPLSASQAPKPGSDKDFNENMRMNTRSSIGSQRVPALALEPNDGQDAKRQVHTVRPRVSADMALDVDDHLQTGPARLLQRQARSASASQVEQSSPFPPASSTDGPGPLRHAKTQPRAGFGDTWYTPAQIDTPDHVLDAERVQHIVYFFNERSWEQAEMYLTSHLEVLMARNDLSRMRRIYHLLGVCTSFRGQWHRAIIYFLAVLRRPVRNIADLDVGDCAAAQWLGDLYSMLNLRTEALVAYCIAERSEFYQDPLAPFLSQNIRAEQNAVQLGSPKADFSNKWAQDAISTGNLDFESIRSPKYVTPEAAKLLFENEPRKLARDDYDAPFYLRQERSRAMAFHHSNPDKFDTVTKFNQTRIGPQQLEPHTAWPMLYDPMFTMANVQRGRLLAYECNLLSVFSSANVDIPRSGPMGLSRMDCFSCTDLTWLITTVRKCLEELEMQWSEVANVEGAWFVARYSFMEAKIATTYYLSIALFRSRFGKPYGVEICPDGICSARLVKGGFEHDKGVHQAESKRMRKMIKDFLEAAALKDRPELKKKRSTNIISR